jgi:hypothetical protein
LENSSNYFIIPRHALTVNGGLYSCKGNAFAQQITKAGKALKSCHTEFYISTCAAFLRLPLLIDYINSHFDEFMRRMDSLNPEEYVLAFTELLKLIIEEE